MAAERVKCTRVWLLLWLCVRLSETDVPRVSMDDDVLQPYAGGHGPSHSHRHVRDCQSVTHGNSTHESWPSSNHSGRPVAESTVFVSDVPESSRWVYGHMTVVHDPLRTVSVLEPGGPGGCNMSLRFSVEETAEAAGCLYAQNAGFFNTKSGACLGNVVNDGKLVQDSGGVQNAQFGIRRDGSLVFGYLSQEEVLDQSNPFVQLVSGVVWLLRNGEVYINQSLQAECDKTQETGRFRSFVDVVSARTAVGHDAEGRLIIFHIDGQTGERGMSLWEVAEFLKKYGVINAINLDGGGSSTFVVNGSLASYPSDHCVPDGRWRCGRNVSTILCVHPPRCHSLIQPGDELQAGHCLAKQMFPSGRREEDAPREQPYLTERTWLLLTVVLVSLLSASLMVHLVRACSGSAASHFPERRDYSYVPLANINGAASRSGDDGGKRRGGGLEMDDSDSQDEIWSPGGRSRTENCD